MVALLSTTYAAPPRLPTHYFKRCANETHNDTATDTAPIPSCDLSGLSQPAHTLTLPSADLQLVMVALGQGTQNYTCGANATAPPTAFGAVAQLYDASCSMSKDPSVGTKALGSIEESAKSIGAHFFVDNTTPDFDITGLGNTQAKKAEECLAPQPAADVKWLRLEAQVAGSTSKVKQIYRLNTVGGLAPGSCEGKQAGEIVAVEYQAQYWIYATPEANAQSKGSLPPAPQQQDLSNASPRLAPLGVFAWSAFLATLLYISSF
ncbi:hypothetical protein CC86DRAFT_403153 [Ophiobolus disseminans]|uniref:Malate dehydrogenase n=1 Tax=Ophiobolus disseminans TaxID=1469910 RepID=A0A6A7A956_9PLEO|nr:hypothetical protein CC86DRAFT_403153 [Ophiobolus disseminans]